MYETYLKEVAAQLEGFKSLLSVMETGALKSDRPETDIARVKRNIALNETVLRLEGHRIMNAART